MKTKGKIQCDLLKFITLIRNLLLTKLKLARLIINAVSVKKELIQCIALPPPKQKHTTHTTLYSSVFKRTKLYLPIFGLEWQQS